MDAIFMQELLRKVLESLHRSHYRADTAYREAIFHALNEAFAAGVHKGLEIALFGGSDALDQKQS